MPYSKPPEKIKDMPKHAQEIWIAAFNAALKEYDDEGKASAVAYAAVKKAGYSQDKDGKWSKANAIQELLESVKRLFDPLIEQEHSADEMDAVYPVSKGAYLPTQTRSFTVTRDAAGKPRWLMIAASAVINKVGAIDSTTLFDNFIKHAPEVGYPILDFWHEREHIRFGVADWLRRDGALYIASGTFDDTDLGRAAAIGLETQTGYWGASIAYNVTETPLILHGEGNIPVYTNGINNFISIVPKRRAANLFTTASVAEEVRRMNQAVYDELVKLVGAERAAQFAGDVDDANRTITETGMVTRSDAPPAEAAQEATPEVAEVAPTETPQIEPQVETRQEPPAADTSLDEIKSALVALSERVAKLEQGAGTAQEESARAITHETELLAKLDERLAGVESVKQRWLDWLNDLPEHIKQEADSIYRARNQEPALMTMAQIAEQNVSKLNRGPHQRHQ